MVLPMTQSVGSLWFCLNRDRKNFPLTYKLETKQAWRTLVSVYQSTGDTKYQTHFSELCTSIIFVLVEGNNENLTGAPRARDSGSVLDQKKRIASIDAVFQDAFRSPLPLVLFGYRNCDVNYQPSSPRVDAKHM